MRRHALHAIMALTIGTTPVLGQTGELRVAGGLARGSASSLSTAPAGTASLSFLAGAFSLGPEVLYLPGDPQVWGLGMVTRVRIHRSGLRPYLVGGLSGNYWTGLVSAGLFSGSFGAGVVLNGQANPMVTVEARYYDKLQRIATEDGNWAFVTLTVGIRFGW
jgi:hypothetical protein